MRAQTSQASAIRGCSPRSGGGRQIRTSRQISNIAEKANRDARQMLELAEADLELGFFHVKALQACRKSLAELVDANDRAFRASRWRRGSRVARPRAHRAHHRGGPRETLWGGRRGVAT